MRAAALVLAWACGPARADPPPATATTTPIRAPRTLPSTGGCVGFAATGSGGVFVTMATELPHRSFRVLYVAPGDAPNFFLSDTVSAAAEWTRGLPALDAALAKLPLVACLPVAADNLIVRGRSRFVITTRTTDPTPTTRRSRRVEVSRNGMVPRVLAELTISRGSVTERLETLYTNPMRTHVALHLVIELGPREREDRFMIVPLD